MGDSTEEKWAILTDDEKNKIIAEKIFDLKEGKDFNYTEYPVASTGGIEVYIGNRNYLNWEGFGLIVEKMPELFATWELGYCRVDKKYNMVTNSYPDSTFHATPWDAAAISFLKMKGIKI